MLETETILHHIYFYNNIAMELTPGTYFMGLLYTPVPLSCIDIVQYLNSLGVIYFPTQESALLLALCSLLNSPL